MSDMKQVKVDNWGIYFLQRLKHFFNRTDYCDLTLQFQDNAQLKVHRLVLNACTEYFEILERTCEMYEDCLVMPEDLQADVVVPIVNFMYTGQLEFRMEALEKLYQTSQVMNIPVLSKLLEAHRGSYGKKNQAFKARTNVKRTVRHSLNSSTNIEQTFNTSSAKRSYTKAFEGNKPKIIENFKPEPIKPSKIKENDTNVVYRENKYRHPVNKDSYRIPSPLPLDPLLYNKKLILGDPRPTRYELPEELDTDNIFDSSFTNISYTSQPLMVHPETTKQYSKKKNTEPTTSKKVFANSTVDIVECKKVSKTDNIFENDSQSISYDDMYGSAYLSVKDEPSKDTNQLFDQMLDGNEGAKVTIEAKDKQASNLDHAKIISEVLKKYPHLVKSNKNIKLKILNSPAKTKKPHSSPNLPMKNLPQKEPEVLQQSFTYETDVLDSKEAAKLIAMGAENTKGPWICLICGTPGRALNFTSYYNFRRHLVEVHQEKPVSTICEYCGVKSHKRNYLLHHIYSKHGVPPPPQYHFPKCNQCDYIALTEGFLVKHKLTHNEDRKFRCPVCFNHFASSSLLSKHMQNMHIMNAPKTHMQCNYCMKVFMRANNYLAHLKTSHKEQAIKDGVILDSDEEMDKIEEENTKEIKPFIKYEIPLESEEFEDEMQYKNRDASHTHIAKKSKVSVSNQKILNPGYVIPKTVQAQKVNTMMSDDHNDYLQQEKSKSPELHEENIIIINDNEYIMKDNQLIPRKTATKSNQQYIISDYIDDEAEQNIQNLDTGIATTSMEFSNLHPDEIIQQPKMIIKKSANIPQPIQIVVSNEEEYKAFMASNHSIIFDESDPNKTLTVLSAAQNSTLNNSAMELDNNQTNDMMIIQDDYPMSVSEAVPTDNSKYVVVYSHAMENDDSNNKQYEIITSQELGAQYVQSSAVLTQNFETITTTTPVVSTNVMVTHIEENWHQNNQQNTENQALVNVTSESQLEIVNETHETHVANSSDLSELPEVELAKNVMESEQHRQENMEQPSNVNCPEILQAIPSIEENQFNHTTESIDTAESVEIPIDSASEKIITSTEQTELATETCQADTYSEVVDTTQNQQTALPMEEQNDDEIIEESSSIPETENTDSVEPTLNIVEDVPTSEENTVTEEIPSINHDIEPVIEAKKQIQNLTSEWSEDEYDTTVEESTELINDPKSPESEEEPELEESIENIEQEVHKQITIKGTEVAIGEEKSLEVDQSTQELKEQETVIVEATQEKISSLLNDWEDNDSQEDNSTDEKVNPISSQSTDINGPETSKSADAEESNSVTATIEAPKNDDKIKSLVSDWDDDDEENKD